MVQLIIHFIPEPSQSDRVWVQGCVTKYPVRSWRSCRMTPSRLIIQDKVQESADHACPSRLEGSNYSYLLTIRFLPLYKEETRTPKLNFVRASWSPRHYPSTPAFLPSAPPLSPSPWMWQATATLKAFPVCTTMQGKCWKPLTLPHSRCACTILCLYFYHTHLRHPFQKGKDWQN